MLCNYINRFMGTVNNCSFLYDIGEKNEKQKSK